MTNDLFRLKNWLRESGITHVAMERFFIPWKKRKLLLKNGDWNIIRSGHIVL
jgi:hypothetical protein